MGRKRHQDDWVFGDVRIMLAFFVLLFLSGIDVRFMWGIAAIALYVAFLGVRYVVRERRRDRRPPDPFWADRLGPR